MKKLLSVLVLLTCCFGGVFALGWNYDNKGTLTVTGEGAMPDFEVYDYDIFL